MTYFDPNIVSKAAFAKLRGVSKAAVSQYIKHGKLNGEAFVGEGRTQKINVEIANAQLAARLDMGQAIGNGAKANSAATVIESSPPVNLYQGIKTKKAAIELRRAERAEAFESGKYMLTQDVEAMLVGALGLVVDIYDNAIPQLADELASEYKLSSHDLIFKIKDVMDEIKTNASKAFARRAELVDEFVEADDGNDIEKPIAPVESGS